MGTYGYSGKILHVDLSTGRIDTEELDLYIAKRFIGDIGINLRLAYDLIKPGIDPLSPENVIIIGAGPLVGTRLLAPRCSILTKYPLTGAIAYANCGMSFSRRLKFAGYDHLIITGRAKSPVYLKIFDDNIELCDAKHLWGKDIVEATDALWDKHGKTNSIMAIGQAGENQAKLALALVEKISSAGKGGLGAVMGSKNLKAIVVNGTRRVKVADRKRFNEAIDHMPTKRKVDPRYFDDMDDPGLVKKFGKLLYIGDSIKRAGGVPYKNWTELYPWEEYDKTYGVKVFFNKIDRVPVACPGCPHACKDLDEVKEGEYKGLKVDISSMSGRLYDLGLRCGGDSIEKAIKLCDILNRYGVCSHEFAPIMGLAIELYERGIITKEDTEGLVLKRDFETAVTLVEQVAFRRGIGATLGDGPLGIIRRFGKECEKYSCHIKGLEPQVDPRNKRFTMESFEQIVSPQGASSGELCQSGSFRVEEGFSQEPVKAYCEKIMGVPKEAEDRILSVPYGYNVARLLPYAENFYILLTSLGVCDHRTAIFDYFAIAELYSAATGVELTATELKEAAERIWNMYKAINVREGFSRKHDRIPPRWLEPLKTASGEDVPPIGCEGKTLSANDLYKLLDDYYEERGWDIKKGIPTEAKLVDLGLEEIIGTIEPSLAVE